MQTTELLAGMVKELAGQRTFGPPFERDGVTVLPVAIVRAGGGIGGRGRPRRADAQEAEGNGGVGIVSRPVGAWVIRQGEVSWQPAVDVNRVILGGQAVAVVALLLLRWLLQAGRRVPVAPPSP